MKCSNSKSHSRSSKPHLDAHTTSLHPILAPSSCLNYFDPLLSVVTAPINNNPSTAYYSTSTPDPCCCCHSSSWPSKYSSYQELSKRELNIAPKSSNFELVYLFATMSTQKRNPFLAMSAGCVAGGIEATAVWPMEYIKVRSFVRSFH